MHRTRQSEWFLGRLSGPLLKTGFSLMKNLLKPLAKTVSATDTAIQKKMLAQV